MMSGAEYMITAIGWTMMGGLIGYLLSMSKSQTREMQAREDGFNLGVSESANSQGGTIVTYEHKQPPFDWSTEL